MHFRHLLAGLGALLLLSVGGLAHAQPSGISQKVAVCDPKFPNNCLKPAADGSQPVTGSGGGGGASYTAAAAPYAVSAGTNKPAGISTTNSAQWTVPVKPGTTTEIDLSTPSAVRGIDGSTIATAANPLPVQAQAAASASGGATAYGLQSAASTNATSVKASAGTLYGLNLTNTTTTVYYLRMYNLATAPTCSSATGFVRSWAIPPAASAGLVGGFAVPVPAVGVAFDTGIAFCVTGGSSSTDNTNAATGLLINLDYK